MPINFTTVFDAMRGNEPIFAMLGIVAGGLLTAFGGGYGLGVARTRRKLLAEQERQRFEKVYSPLWGMFLDKFVEGASSELSPRLRDRVANAREILNRSGRRKIRRAIAALFDREVSSSWEMAYGGSFPLGAITKHLKGKEHLADAKLMTLTKSANLASYEEGHEVTEQDMALLTHIYGEYHALNKRFVGSR
jgi:hypothetical protein